MSTVLRHTFLVLLASTLLIAQSQNSNNKNSGNMAVVDGGAGPCSIELTVLGPDTKPVYNASVKVHVSYGFGGFHRLDLQAGTNTDGKAKFTGLPTRVHRPPLEVNATKDDLSGTITFDPATQCQAAQQITLQKTPPPAAQ